MRRSVFFLGIFVCFAGVIGWFTSAPSRQPPSSAAVAIVKRGSLTDTVAATGVLEPSQLAQIRAPVSGQLTTFHVSLGDKVHAGDVIAELDSFGQQNRLRLATALLSQKQAAQDSRQVKLDWAERSLTRQRQLSAKQVISSAALQDGEAAVRIARAKLDLSTAKVEEASVGVEKAQIDLANTRITTPIDGRVLAIVKPGQTQPSSVIAVVAQTDMMRARVQVSEADIECIKVGQPVHFTVGNRKPNPASLLTEVEPAPSTLLSDQGPSGGQVGGRSGQTQPVYYNAFFEVPNKEGKLLAMMTADVTITVSAVDDVLLVLRNALVGPDADGSYGARVEKGAGATEARRVRVGLVNQTDAEILGGLSEGEKIILPKDSGTTRTDCSIG
ncbi:efflux RND transporter periplasmic adaptor subunit [Mesorhizobium argentiipisi]